MAALPYKRRVRRPLLRGLEVFRLPRQGHPTPQSSYRAGWPDRIVQLSFELVSHLLPIV